MGLRIAHLVAGLVNPADGVRTTVEALSRTQAASGYEVKVFGLLSCDWEHDGAARWQGAPVELSRPIGPRRFGFAPSMTAQLDLWSPDIVHLHGAWLWLGLAALKQRQVRGTRLLISTHGTLSPVALQFGRWKKRAASWLYQNRVFGGAHAFHATSDTEFQEIRDYGLHQPVAVVAPGVDIPDLKPYSNTPPRRMVLSLGRIHPKKALDTLIKAWAEIHAEFPDWFLLIVGSDENGYEARLRRLIADRGIERIKIQGPCFGPEKAELLTEASLFVLPSRNENFAMVVAESLAAGTPVVSSRGAPWPGLVEHGCGWWTDHGVEPMIVALREAMSLPPSRLRAMGMRGREWMEREYSWRAAARRMAEVYRWLCEMGKVPDTVRFD